MSYKASGYVIGFDTETTLFGPGEVVPKLICLTINAHEQAGPIGDVSLFSNADPVLLDSIKELFVANATGEYIKVAQNAAFDLAVICRHDPSLIPHIFANLEQGLVHCTILREKFLNLAITGQIDNMTIGGNPDDDAAGVKSKIKYDLASLVSRYLGKDRSADKEGEDAWRLNYGQLDGIPSAQWPPEASKYACEDASDVAAIWWLQEAKRQQVIEDIGHDPFATLGFRVMVDFCLFLMGAWGCATDPVAYQEIEAQLKETLKPENLSLLIEKGILRPGEPPRPKVRGEGMTAGKEESINKKVLTQYVLDLAAANPSVKLHYNELTDTARAKGETQGSLSLDSEFIETNWHLDPVLEQYKHRSDVQKLVTTELPRMCWPKGSGNVAPVVHPCYDSLKSSGRTSSYGNDKYPSFNIQNVDPRARGIIVPRPGNLLFSIDYSGMELGTLGQRCGDLFGSSVLADKINAGIDPHAYLGAQLAYAMHDGFRSEADGCTASTNDEVFEVFKVCFKNGPLESQDVFKHFRKFAKPTGLGYPGGLGADTFISYAKATYGVTVDVETAKQLKAIWLNTYPEMVAYFDYIKSSCKDGHNIGYYSFTSPMGMYRAGASYCACANGLGLQTPSAEGALTAVINTVRACFDPSMESILYGGEVRPIGFIHDELFGEIAENDFVDERLDEMVRIMVESMRTITPAVTPRANAVLMRRWNKDAEGALDATGKRIVWEPKAIKAA